MKTINEMNAQERYVSPRAKVIEVKIEGVLCNSTENSINWFSDDEEELSC